MVCNQASVSRDRHHIIDLLLPDHRAGRLEVKVVFGPQHGLFGHTQDNMIEWEGRLDPRTGLRVASLYGEHREPTAAMLAGVDRLVVDLPDVGARYYTFIWTLALCMRACARLRIPVTVLDRPNPIGGLQVEGPVLDPEFASFVGLHPLPIRHSMTVGEVATYLQQNFIPNVQLDVAKMEGWSREFYFEDTGLPWVMPSPNMPTVDTAVVYPGGCLLEGTNLSEGRGTTRPFEMVGAPYVDGWSLCDGLNALELSGCGFRPIQFEPTSNKWKGQICEGVFVHVLDRAQFRPFMTYVAILREIRRLCGTDLEWVSGPYEYEFAKRPIDIIAGNGWLAEAIDGLSPLEEILVQMNMGLRSFTPLRDRALLYN